jgi:CheY-like chemotaxis protein
MSKAARILVIDDEPKNIKLLEACLGPAGYQVFSELNSVHALAKLKDIAPDLIILDLNMPRLGGLGFYQKICNGLDHPPYPVLVLTARANMEQLLKQMNVDGFMSKPIDIDKLLIEVKAILAKKKA